MERSGDIAHDDFIKGLMDISRAITSDLYLEDILKLIVMVTANVTGFAICSLWLLDENENPAPDSAQSHPGHLNRIC